MSRMIDLIRQSAVPASLMRTAARGALSLPVAEMLEIMVFLTEHPLFGEQARLTLAGWDEAATLAVISDSHAPVEVLNYFSALSNLRPRLLPALLENPALPEARLIELAQAGPREFLTMMLASDRVRSCPGVRRALLMHPDLKPGERAQLTPALNTADGEPGPEDLESSLAQYERENAGEINAQQGQSFHLTDGTTEEQAEIAAAGSTACRDAPAVAGISLTAVAARVLGSGDGEERERLSPLQKIARMSVGERVQLAYRGSRDERAILIRDGARVISAAVLESPKLTESEVELFAAMRNVGEHVLRIIASKRKFMRRYALARILTANPRCPIEVALPLIKGLLLSDLKNLMSNKNVADAVRHFAYKVWTEKSIR